MNEQRIEYRVVVRDESGRVLLRPHLSDTYDEAAVFAAIHRDRAEIQSRTVTTTEWRTEEPS